jgi:hypothetical protein
MLNNSDANERQTHLTDERWRAIVWRHRLFGTGGVILALAIIGIAWYGYPRLRGQTETIAQLSSMQKAVDGLGDRMKAADSKFESWSTDQQDLRDQMTKLGRRMTARIENARKQVQQSSAEMFRQVQAQIDKQVDSRIQGVQTRLAHLESLNSVADTQITDLRRELAQVRSEMAQQQVNELRAVRREIRDYAADDKLQMASLKNSEERNRKDVDAITNGLALQRIDFEVTKNHNQELAPGISLTLTGTDATYRRVRGWVWIMPDRRTLWLRGQSAQEPVIFYGYKDGKKRELVITNVTKNDASGYLLLPKTTNSTVAAAINRGQ